MKDGGPEMHRANIPVIARKGRRLGRCNGDRDDQQRPRLDVVDQKGRGRQGARRLARADRARARGHRPGTVRRRRQRRLGQHACAIEQLEAEGRSGRRRPGLNEVGAASGGTRCLRRKESPSQEHHESSRPAPRRSPLTRGSHQTRHALVPVRAHPRRRGSDPRLGSSRREHCLACEFTQSIPREQGPGAQTKPSLCDDQGARVPPRSQGTGRGVHLCLAQARS